MNCRSLWNNNGKQAMQIKFKCRCGARLRCDSRGIGRVLECPGCSAKVEVPVPSLPEVQRVLKEVPHAYPSKSTSHYLDLARQIHAHTTFNVQICKVTGYPTLAFDCVDQAKRMLRNIAVFLNDADRESIPQASPASGIVNVLASFAAGQDFGGTGTSAARSRQYQRWQNSQGNNRPSHDVDEDPFRGQVFAAIAAVESLLT